MSHFFDWMNFPEIFFLIFSIESQPKFQLRVIWWKIEFLEIGHITQKKF